MAVYRRCRNCGNEEEKATLYQCGNGHVYCEECSGGSTFFGHPKCPKCDDGATILGFIEHEEDGDDDDSSDDSDADTSSSADPFVFPTSVVSACHLKGLSVTESDIKKVVFEVSHSAVRRKIYCYQYGSHLEFTCRSRFDFSSEEEIPQRLAILALRKSGKSKNAFLCLEKVAGRFVFSTMWNLFQERFNSDWLDTIPPRLIEVCDEFEKEA